MIASFRHRARLGIGGFFALRFLGLIIWSTARGGDAGGGVQRLFEFVFVLGTAFLLWGCWALAKGKGRSAWWALLGLAGIVGLVVALLLPDRAPAGTTAVAPEGGAG
ncbi:MAG: hypothetical protein F9K18_10370 [Thermoanaerobaculia bacterium]|nr:MAG: hypothetical protein F9K18_10370 [Thermoanaerobaculia bacterium]